VSYALRPTEGSFVSTDKRSQAAEKAYAVFNEAIADPDRRRALAEDPEGTFKEAGVKFSDLPGRLRSLLKDLSYEELRVLYRYNDTLVKANLMDERRSAGGFSTMCKF
jgi:hypothetical protein